MEGGFALEVHDPAQAGMMVLWQASAAGEATLAELASCTTTTTTTSTTTTTTTIITTTIRTTTCATTTPTTTTITTATTSTTITTTTGGGLHQEHAHLPPLAPRELPGPPPGQPRASAIYVAEAPYTAHPPYYYYYYYRY